MSMKVRVEAFNALGKAGKVSQYLLMQTLSKRVLEENKFIGQPSAKHLRLRALTAAGAFLHGLEDEFYEVPLTPCNYYYILDVTFSIHLLKNESIWVVFLS